MERKRQLRRPGPVAPVMAMGVVTPQHGPPSSANSSTATLNAHAYTPHKYLTSTDALNAGATVAEWLDSAVKEGYSRFAPAFTSRGCAKEPLFFL